MKEFDTEKYAWLAECAVCVAMKTGFDSMFSGKGTCLKRLHQCGSCPFVAECRVEFFFAVHSCERNMRVCTEFVPFIKNM